MYDRDVREQGRQIKREVGGGSDTPGISVLRIWSFLQFSSM